MSDAAASFERFAQLKRCPVCQSVMTPPAPCERCGGAIECPPHETWPKVLKMWLLWRTARKRFASIYRRAEQFVWEMLLRDEFVLAGGQHANPYDTKITSATPAADLYPIALRLAMEWKSDGYPLDVTLAAQPLHDKTTSASEQDSPPADPPRI